MATKNPAQDKFGEQANTSSSGGLSQKSQAYADETEKTGASEILVASEAAKTIRAAVNRVVLLYSHARRADVHAFIDNYTYRPVATMTQIFGTTDLVIKKVEEWKTRLVKTGTRFPRYSTHAASSLSEVAGLRAPEKIRDLTTSYASALVEQAQLGRQSSQSGYSKKKYKETSYLVTAGTEGFHSRAFSDEDNLFGLVEPKIKKILGLDRRDEKLLAKLDTRKERREAVRAYVGALTASHGLRG